MRWVPLLRYAGKKGGFRLLTAAWKVGRLVELRLLGCPTMEDTAQFERDAHSAVAACVKAVGGPVVVCTDIRESHLFRPNVTERFVQMMRTANRSVERNAMLANSSALLGLQIVRLLGEADPKERRRVFAQPEPLLAWIDELLDVRERIRVRQFLAGLEPRSNRPGIFGARHAAPAGSPSGRPPRSRRPPRQ